MISAADISILFSFSRISSWACVCVLVCMDAFLTYRATQTPLPLSKRLNCVLISCCEFPSRNPTSPLDCRAADRFPLLLFLLLPALYVTFPALSSRFFYASVDVHGTATQVRTTSEGERELGSGSAGGRTLAGYWRDDAAGVSVFVGNRRTGRWICLFSGFWIVGGLG